MSSDESAPQCVVCGETDSTLYQSPRDVTNRYPFQGFRHIGKDHDLRWYCQEHRPQSFEILDE